MDRPTRQHLAKAGAPRQVADRLLAGEMLRGLTDQELASIAIPTGILPSSTPNPFHQRKTVDALLDLLPHSTELTACPEPMRPEFSRHLEAFVRTVVDFASGPENPSIRGHWRH